MIKKSALLLAKKWDFLLVLFFACLYIIVFSKLSILRHESFASGYDLANMGQTVWNTFAGRPFALSGVESTISRFSIHADLILILLSPFYLIWERVLTLLIIQSTLLGLGAIPTFFLAKKVLSKSAHFNILQTKIASLTLVIVYLLNPSMQWTNIYDFHGVSLAIPFLLSAFYFAYERKWLGYATFVFLAILTKEEISLFTAMLGLVVAFLFKERPIGFVTFVCSVIWFLAMVFWVIPFFSQSGTYWALDWFSPLNLEKNGLAQVQVPSLINQFTLSKDAINFYLLLLKPFGFLPLLGLPWLVLSLPELSINLLSSQAQMRSIMFHYDSGIIPSLVIASIFALKYINLFLHFLKGKLKIKSTYIKLFFYLVLLYVLVVSIRVNYHYSPLPTTPSCWCIMYQVKDEDREFEKVLRAIPRGATITSSSEIRAHLTRRENSFNLPSATDSAQYIAILNQNRIVGNYEPKAFENALIKVLLSSKDHELVHTSQHFYLFKRK